MQALRSVGCARLSLSTQRASVIVRAGPPAADHAVQREQGLQALPLVLASLASLVMTSSSPAFAEEPLISMVEPVTSSVLVANAGDDATAYLDAPTVQAETEVAGGDTARVKALVEMTNETAPAIATELVAPAEEAPAPADVEAAFDAQPADPAEAPAVALEAPAVSVAQPAPEVAEAVEPLAAEPAFAESSAEASIELATETPAVVEPAAVEQPYVESVVVGEPLAEVVAEAAEPAASADYAPSALVALEASQDAEAPAEAAAEVAAPEANIAAEQVLAEAVVTPVEVAAPAPMEAALEAVVAPTLSTAADVPAALKATAAAPSFDLQTLLAGFSAAASASAPGEGPSAETLTYGALGAAAVSFLATFLLAPRFKESFKEPVDWKEMYEVLAARGVKTVTPEEAYSKAKKGAVLLDVRLADKHADRAPEPSVNVPLYQPIAGWDPASNIRRAGFAFFGIFGTELNPNFVAEALAKVPKNKEVFVMCESGGTIENKPGTMFGFQSRSLKAVYYLQQAGYNRVLHVKGGLGDWQRAGLPVSDSSEQEPPAKADSGSGSVRGTASIRGAANIRGTSSSRGGPASKGTASSAKELVSVSNRSGRK